MDDGKVAGRIGNIDRRRVLGLGGGLAVALASGRSALAQKAGPIKVASVYTVPVEQQWVSRIHKALNAAKDRGEITYKWSENTANTDYERVMRQFSTEGSDLIVGESFAVERAARSVAADFPKIAYLMGSSFGPSKPNFAVFDNFIHEPSYLTGIIAGKATKSNVIGLVGGYAIPEVNRLMNAFIEGATSVNPDVKFLVTFINSWYDPPKAKEVRLCDGRSQGRHPLCRAFRRLRCGQGARRQGDRQCDRYIGAISRRDPGIRALAYGADHRPRHQGGRGRRL